MRRGDLQRGLAVLLLGWLYGNLARAHTPELTWHAPIGCPDANQVRTALASTLSALAGVRRVEVEIEPDGDAFGMELVIETAEGRHHKHFAAGLCNTFVELLRLELGFAGIPSGDVRRQGRTPTGTLRFGGRLSGAVASGPVPSPSGAIALALFMSVHAVQVEVGAAYTLPRTIRYETEREVGARFDLVGGEARGCYRLSFAQIAVPLCVGTELGSLRGRGRGLEQTAQARRLWAAVFIAPAFQFPIAGPVSGWLEVAGSLRLWRSRFGVQNLPPLYGPDLLNVRGALGIALTFE